MAAETNQYVVIILHGRNSCVTGHVHLGCWMDPTLPTLLETLEGQSSYLEGQYSERKDSVKVTLLVFPRSFTLNFCLCPKKTVEANSVGWFWLLHGL